MLDQFPITSLLHEDYRANFLLDFLEDSFLIGWSANSINLTVLHIGSDEHAIDS